LKDPDMAIKMVGKPAAIPATMEAVLEAMGQ
jgi:hypothetical protein